MKDILFTHAYFLWLDPKQWRTGQPYAPLATLWAAAVMREKGYDVHFHDVQFSKGPGDIAPVLLEHQPRYFIIYDDGFNYLTKMCLTNMRDAAFRMIQIAKASGAVVIVSSSDATDHFEAYLAKGADFVLIGEAEQALLELITALEKKEQDLVSIPGIAFQKEQSTVKTTSRPVMRNLDALPLPAWDLVDFVPYRKMWYNHAGYFSINIGTTRGCPFKCNWCAKPIYGNRYNARSPQHVARELKMLKEITAFEHVWFCDDIFGLKPGWVKEFANEVGKEKIKFRFKIQSRADLLIQEDYVLALKEAGCENVWMGAESGSQKILDAMDKGIRVEQIKQATALLKQHGIRVSFFIQFGYPGETKEDILLTIRMIHELTPDEIGISVSYPLPGTPFYEKVKNELSAKSNWTDSDELVVMFRGTYGALFYKQLHRYVHKSYKKRLAVEQLRILFTRPGKTNWQQLKKALGAFLLIPSVYWSKRKLQLLERTT